MIMIEKLTMPGKSEYLLLSAIFSLRLSSLSSLAYRCPRMTELVYVESIPDVRSNFHWQRVRHVIFRKSTAPSKILKVLFE